MGFKLPPKPYTAKNEFRRAGFEFEFAGLELEMAAEIIIELYGGERSKISRFSEKVVNTKLGDVKLEFDSRVLKEKRYESFMRDKLGLNLEKLSLQKEVENIVASISSNLVPFEVILPPIPLDELEQTEKFRAALLQNHAEGTKASPLYAFAFQINMELPANSVELITDYLKAFLLLQYWIFDVSKVSFTRHHLTNYIKDFPDEYLVFILREDYKPDLDQLIEDYKKFNPTRNRPLDLFPLFVHLKGEEVRNGIEHPGLVKPRPTFHYRLPDSLIDDPHWRISDVWNTWVTVEELGEDKVKLKRMMTDFQHSYHSESIMFRKKWIRVVKEYLKN